MGTVPPCLKEYVFNVSSHHRLHLLLALRICLVSLDGVSMEVYRLPRCTFAASIQCNDIPDDAKTVDPPNRQ